MGLFLFGNYFIRIYGQAIAKMKMADFITLHHFNSHIACLNETGADNFCPMMNNSRRGTIPATIIINAKPGYKKF